MTPGEGSGGIDELLCSIPVRLKIAGLQALGLVLDADQDLGSRWDAVCHRLRQAGYHDLPAHPHPQGSIVDDGEHARIGVWLMPDNQLPGILEDFVTCLVPEHDLLLPKAEDILADIEQNGIHRYKQVYHPKALIHTWLAWQEIPGRPMGQSITAHVLLHNAEVAMSFVNWLSRLFIVHGARM